MGGDRAARHAGRMTTSTITTPAPAHVGVQADHTRLLALAAPLLLFLHGILIWLDGLGAGDAREAVAAANSAAAFGTGPDDGWMRLEQRAGRPRRRRPGAHRGLRRRARNRARRAEPAHRARAARGTPRRVRCRCHRCRVDRPFHCVAGRPTSRGPRRRWRSPHRRRPRARARHPGRRGPYAVRLTRAQRRRGCSARSCPTVSSRSARSCSSSRSPRWSATPTDTD